MSRSTSPWRLVVCDMDGTLVRGTTALAHLSEQLGHERLIDDVEGELAHGRITDREVAENYARAYRGLALADAVRAMAEIPSIDDVATGVTMLRTRSVDAVIATVSWKFAARALADSWGFSEVCGADLELDRKSGCFTGRVAQHFRPEDKTAFVKQHCRAKDVRMDQVVAIGDSRSDLPLFKAVGFSVALNATHDARAAASVVVDSSSFLDALRAVPDLVV